MTALGPKLKGTSWQPIPRPHCGNIMVACSKVISWGEHLSGSLFHGPLMRGTSSPFPRLNLGRWEHHDNLLNGCKLKVSSWQPVPRPSLCSEVHHGLSEENIMTAGIRGTPWQPVTRLQAKENIMAFCGTVLGCGEQHSSYYGSSYNGHRLRGSSYQFELRPLWGEHHDSLFYDLGWGKIS